MKWNEVDWSQNYFKISLSMVCNRLEDLFWLNTTKFSVNKSREMLYFCWTESLAPRCTNKANEVGVSFSVYYVSLWKQITYIYTVVGSKQTKQKQNKIEYKTHSLGDIQYNFHAWFLFNQLLYTVIEAAKNSDDGQRENIWNEAEYTFRLSNRISKKNDNKTRQ